MTTFEAPRVEVVENALEPETAEPRRRVKRKTINTIIWFVALLVLVAIVLYPLVWLFFSTFKPSSEFGQNPGLIPENPTFDNYTKVVEGIAGTPLWRFFANSFFIAIMAVIGTVLSSALAAYAFARIRFRGVGILFAAMIGTLLLPFHVIIIPQYIMFQKLELVDTYWPLILPKFLATEAFFVFLMVQFMRGIPRSLDEAAEIDGCGPYRRFFFVVLPLTKPALVTTAVFSFIWTWNDFFTQLVYLNDLEAYTVPIGLRLFLDSSGQAAIAPMFAMSVLSLVPVFLFFLVFQRLIVDGINTSGIKG
jgi:multiple sugar transport system permease protein